MKIRMPAGSPARRHAVFLQLLHKQCLREISCGNRQNRPDTRALGPTTKMITGSSIFHSTVNSP